MGLYVPLTAIGLCIIHITVRVLTIISDVPMLGLAATSHPRRLEDKVWLNIEGGGKERTRKISSEIIRRNLARITESTFFSRALNVHWTFAFGVDDNFEVIFHYSIQSAPQILDRGKSFLGHDTFTCKTLSLYCQRQHRDLAYGSPFSKVKGEYHQFSVKRCLIL